MERAAIYVRTCGRGMSSAMEAGLADCRRFVEERPAWRLTQVYLHDDTAAGRRAWQGLLRDCSQGMLERIATPSVTMLRLDALDGASLLRDLRRDGIGVWFVRERLCSLDLSDELMTTLLLQMAVEKKRRKSKDRTEWQEAQFAKGRCPTIPTKRFLGFKRGADGELEIDEDEAAIVRRIYELFLQGWSTGRIAAGLTKDGVPSPGGRCVWNYSVVLRILRNEKYKGDARLQKTFTEEGLVCQNRGERTSYYVQDSHPAIVSADVWEAVQTRR